MRRNAEAIDSNVGIRNVLRASAKGTFCAQASLADVSRPVSESLVTWRSVCLGMMAVGWISADVRVMVIGKILRHGIYLGKGYVERYT
jgi:hypothetical protein